MAFEGGLRFLAAIVAGLLLAGSAACAVQDGLPGPGTALPPAPTAPAGDPSGEGVVPPGGEKRPAHWPSEREDLARRKKFLARFDGWTQLAPSLAQALTGNPDLLTRDQAADLQEVVLRGRSREECLKLYQASFRLVLQPVQLGHLKVLLSRMEASGRSPGPSDEPELFQRLEDDLARCAAAETRGLPEPRGMPDPESVEVPLAEDLEALDEVVRAPDSDLTGEQAGVLLGLVKVLRMARRADRAEFDHAAGGWSPELVEAVLAVDPAATGAARLEDLLQAKAEGAPFPTPEEE